MNLEEVRWERKILRRLMLAGVVVALSIWLGVTFGEYRELVSAYTALGAVITLLVIALKGAMNSRGS